MLLNPKYMNTYLVLYFLSHYKLFRLKTDSGEGVLFDKNDPNVMHPNANEAKQEVCDKIYTVILYIVMLRMI